MECAVRSKKMLVIACVVCTSLYLCLPARADSERLQRVGTILIPGTTAAHQFDDFDLGFVDGNRDLYLLSDISNRSIDAFRASTGEFLFRVGGFFGHRPPGYAHVGPTGVVTAGQEIWAADAPSEVKVIDLNSHRVIDTIETGGRARADTLSYDERDGIILITNPDDSPRFVTLVAATPGHRILGKIEFPQATGELEASAWWSETGLFYLLVAELDGKPAKGALLAIDPLTRTVVNTFIVPECRPTGIAIGKEDTAIVGCLGEGLGRKYGFPIHTLVINLRTGDILARVTGVTGSDQVWFNSGDNRYYVAAEASPQGPVLAAISADATHRVLTAPTDAHSHSVAADSSTNRVFVPFGPRPTDPKCRHGCIAVFSVMAE
jgi:hypothetical protein